MSNTIRRLRLPLVFAMWLAMLPASAGASLVTNGGFESGEPFTSPAFKHMRVSAAGQGADYEYDTAPAWHWDMAWASHAWTFTANAAVRRVAVIR